MSVSALCTSQLMEQKDDLVDFLTTLTRSTFGASTLRFGERDTLTASTLAVVTSGIGPMRNVFSDLTDGTRILFPADGLQDTMVRLTGLTPLSSILYFGENCYATQSTTRGRQFSEPINDIRCRARSDSGFFAMGRAVS